MGPTEDQTVRRWFSKKRRRRKRDGGRHERGERCEKITAGDKESEEAKENGKEGKSKDRKRK